MPAVDFQITSRAPFAGGRAFGEVGPYEQIRALVTFAVDPASPANQRIVDVGLAPRDAAGKVRFTADLALLAPRDAGRGNGRLLVDVTNRGRRLAFRFNRAPPDAGLTAEGHPGDGFLFNRGWTLASIGWQHDVPRGGPALGLEAPAVFIDGRPVEGRVMVELRPAVETTTQLLSDRGHRPYPAADVDEPEAVMFEREWEDGPDIDIPRSAWRFARPAQDGSIVPSTDHVYMEGGFQPGKLYYLIYRATGAVLAGSGVLSVREFAAFLRHPSALNPLTVAPDYVYGFGVSQTGRLLRQFLYDGLNLDEQGRQVYDGLLVHIGGAMKGQFNHRLAQPSVQSAPGFGCLFPFADEVSKDALTGQTDGLLRRQRSLGGVPKVFYTNSSSEYWRGDGSLLHIDPASGADLAAQPETRIYHFAGSAHVSGFSPSRQKPLEATMMGRYPGNGLDIVPLLRAALVNLDRWAAEGVEPPAARHPRRSDGTAVQRAEALAAFRDLPGQALPDPARLPLVRTVDLGPDAAAGVARYPMTEGEAYRVFVSAVDGDGNETAGIRLPDLTVPVATNTGWNLRHPDIGAPELQLPLQGFSRYFAATGAQRERLGDPRASLEERYSSRDAYLEEVRVEANRLAAQGYLLVEDVELVVENGAARWDAAVRNGGRDIEAPLVWWQESVPVAG